MSRWLLLLLACLLTVASPQRMLTSGAYSCAVNALAVHPRPGGWSHLSLLLRLIRGSQSLLAAQKVPLSTLHLIMRMLQQLARAAAGAGLRLDLPVAEFEQSQLPAEGSSQGGEQDPQRASGRGSSGSYLDSMQDVSSVCTCAAAAGDARFSGSGVHACVLQQATGRGVACPDALG